MPGGSCYFQMDEADVERVIAHPLAMIGSDGLPHDRHPHPRLWGAFPRDFARYLRERGLFTLEQAVHKMSSMTARNFRIADRGLLKAGAMADVAVFDPARIAETATYDQPIRPSVGIGAVFVNGRLTRQAGLSRWQRAGCVGACGPHAEPRESRADVSAPDRSFDALAIVEAMAEDDP